MLNGKFLFLFFMSKSLSVYNIPTFYRSGEGNFDTRGALDIDTSSAMEVGREHF
jgi:hypothetical protein